MRPFLLLSVLVAVSSLDAQAPIVTSKGDPSVNNDTIYKLAVKASDYPDDPIVYLLDDGIVHREADGRGTETFRQIAQVLTDKAAEEMSERSYSYDGSHEKLTLNWVRVLKPDGTIVSDGPSHVQDADVPADEDDPVYTDQKVKRISLSGLTSGMLVDISITREELKPRRPGDFMESWGVNMVAPAFRSRYIVDLPAALKPNIDEQNTSSLRTVRTVKDRTIYTWTAQNVPKIKYEPFAADTNRVIMHLTIGAPTTWGSIAQWYSAKAQGRYVASPALTQYVRGLVVGAKTLDDSIGRVERWVSQDIRYVSLALGEGGFQPRFPDSVFVTKYGDCKDKATLFITALAQIGVTAYPVLLNSSGHVKRAVPSYEQFDHVIAAVQRPSGYQFADLTEALKGYGEPLQTFGGEFGLVVLPNGKSEEVTFPKASLTTNRDSSLLVGALDTAGVFRGRYEEHPFGSFVGVIRTLFANPLDSAKRTRFANILARRFFEDADADSLKVFNGKDMTVTPFINIVITRAQAATTTGGTLILSAPSTGSAAFHRLIERLTSAPKRQFPIDALKVFGRQVSTTEVRITLPNGWVAKLPPSVEATGPFGIYSAEYTQAGNTLRILHRVGGVEGIYPPDKLGELTDWLKKVASDDPKFIVLEKKAQ